MKRRSFLAMIGLAPMVASVKATEMPNNHLEAVLATTDAPIGTVEVETWIPFSYFKTVDPLVLFTDGDGGAHVKPYSQFADDEDRISYHPPAEHEVTARIKNLDRGYSGIVWVR